MSRLFAWPLILLVRVYQATLSPFLGGQCRYHPTCSHYAIQALKEYGAAKGAAMAVRRIARCHPFAKGGYDPVPAPKDDAMRKE
ncbi:MAG: membrane protein insertion efficiency factor YidD [Phycisphaerales bacterium]|nr:membrane protein insertion efficiency factor YidD [Phycisphaerales bacterium]MCB9837394.1 membrane protein insertion efficiency factor YidD [Phycisphaera sp.]